MYIGFKELLRNTKRALYIFKSKQKKNNPNENLIKNG